MNTRKMHIFERLLGTERIDKASRLRATRCGIALAIALALSTAGQTVFALGLGELTATSRLGEPLRAELSLIEAPSERIEAACFKIAPRPTGADDLPRLPRATFVVDRRDRPARLRVSTTHAVNDPIVMVGVSVGCGVGLTREYALLLTPAEMPLIVAPETGATAPRGRASAGRGSAPRASAIAANEWQLFEGETLKSISQALFPGSQRAQRRWINATTKANPDLFRGEGRPASTALPAGTVLSVPDLRRIARAPAAELDQAGSRREPVSRPRRNAKVRTNSDRLSIDGRSNADSDLRLAPVLDRAGDRNAAETPRDLLRQERQLLAALEDQTAMQLALAEKIKRMEETLAGLQASLKNIDQGMGNVARTTQTTPASALAAPAAPPAGVASKPVKELRAEGGAIIPDWLLFLSLAAAMLGLLLFLRRRSQRQKVDASYEATLAEDNPPTPKVSVPPMTDTSPPTQRPAPPEDESLIRRYPVEEEHNIDVAEHESAVELADIMLSFGRVQGAAQTLADYIEANPKQAVRPWLKLLQVYRDADMQTEFDTLAQRLNRTFNVEIMSWDQTPARRFPDTLEAYPHISAKLVESWGSQECLDFLTDLVQDNRNGTRAGFPLAVLREIMLLGSILEQRETAYE